MTWTSTLAWCAASSAIVAVPLLFRLSAVKAQRDLYRRWWERDSGKMIVAQAELDLIREQRREAGRQSHKAERALIAARTEELRRCVAARSIQPVAANPAPGFPAGRQRPEREGGTALKRCSADRTRGRSGQRSEEAAMRSTISRAKPRGNSAPAETPKQKGLANG